MSEQEMDMEEQVLRESIVSAAGVNASNLQIGIRGDPSMRETTVERKRYLSSVDTHLDALMPRLENLMLNHSPYQLFVGFNNGEIRIHSVFDPMRQEIHDAEKMIDPAYIERQFPAVSYDDKVRLIRETYGSLREHPVYQQLPGYWKNIMARRGKDWEPMEPAEIQTVISTLKVLRDMPMYYLRNITINIVQSIVRIQFNCDGTQIVSAENYPRFLDENLSD